MPQALSLKAMAMQWRSLTEAVRGLQADRDRRPCRRGVRVHGLVLHLDPAVGEESGLEGRGLADAVRPRVPRWALLVRAGVRRPLVVAGSVAEIRRVKPAMSERVKMKRGRQQQLVGDSQSHQVMVTESEPANRRGAEM